MKQISESIYYDIYKTEDEEGALFSIAINKVNFVVRITPERLTVLADGKVIAYTNIDESDAENLIDMIKHITKPQEAIKFVYASLSYILAKYIETDKGYISNTAEKYMGMLDSLT